MGMKVWYGVMVTMLSVSFIYASLQMPKELRQGIVPQLAKQLKEQDDSFKQREKELDAKIAQLNAIGKQPIGVSRDEIMPSCLKGRK